MEIGSPRSALDLFGATGRMARPLPVVRTDGLFGPFKGGDRAVSKQSIDIRGMLATRTTDASLRIVTDEGDVVTLSSHSTLEEFTASYRYKARSEGESVRLRGNVREIQLEHNVSLTVEGDLNDEELADIRALVQRIGPALEGFTPEQGARLALTIDGSEFESLEGFRLSVERSVDITRFHVRRREVTERSGDQPGRTAVGVKLPADRMPVLPYDRNDGSRASSALKTPEQPVAPRSAVVAADGEPDIGMEQLMRVLLDGARG